MGLLFLPRREFDSSGNVLNGGKLKFFAAGTTTPKNAYPTEADAQAGTNGQTEFTADSGGLFPAIYGDDDADYKIRLTTSADVQIWEEDNVPAIQATTGKPITRVTQGFNSPLDFGAEGDGVADEQSEVQQAIDQAETDGTYIVDLMGLTFRCDTTLTLHSNVRLQNGTLDFTNSSSTELIKAEGTIGSGVAITNNPAAGDASFNTSDTSSIVVGDLLLCQGTDDWDADGLIQRAFVARVHAVTASTSIDPAGGMRMSLATGTFYRKITPVKNVHLENLDILCPNTASTSAIFLRLCENATVRNVRMDGVPAYGVHVALSYGVLIEDCFFDGDDASNSLTGVVIDEACATVTVRRCRFASMNAEGIAIGPNLNTYEGACLDTVIEQCVFETCDGDCIRGYVGCHDVDYRDNVFRLPQSESILHEGGSATIVGNRIFESVGSLGISVQQDMDQATGLELFVVIDSNRVEDCDITVSNQAGSGVIHSVRISRNFVDGGAIYTDSNFFAEGLALEGNYVDGGYFTVDGATQTLVVAGNTTKSATQQCLQIVAITVSGQYAVTGNVFRKADDGEANIDIGANNEEGLVVGNILENGTYGINLGGTNTCHQGLNVFVGMATGNVNGTFTPALATGRNGSGSTASGTIEIDVT